MEKQDNIIVKSIAFRNFLGKTPSWVIKSGTLVICISTLLLISLAFIVSYNDIIVSDVIVTTKKPIVRINARKSGVIDSIMVKHGQPVTSGQILGVLECQAKLKDVYFLKDKLSRSLLLDTVDIGIVSDNFPSNLVLGDIQTEYNYFLNQYEKRLFFDVLKPDEIESGIIDDQISQKKVAITQLENRVFNFSFQLKLSKQEYEKNKLLKEKGVLSESEYTVKYREYLADLEYLQNVKSDVSQARVELNGLNNQKRQADFRNATNNNTYSEEILRALQNLKNKIALWEQNNLFTSPVDGTISMGDVWKRYQSVKEGKTIFAIMPNKNEGFIGQLKVDAANTGKIKEGQKVIIKLKNYPFEQYGHLEGKVIRMSTIAENSNEGYDVIVGFDSLVTSYNKKLEFKQEMMGRAEIITEELSLAQRILYGIRRMALERNTAN